MLSTNFHLNHGICVPSEIQITKRFGYTHPSHGHLKTAVDKLNKSIGQKEVLLAGQGLDTRWKMKQNKLSPRYNTRIQEIITIHAKQSLKQTANLDNYFKDKQKGLELS